MALSGMDGNLSMVKNEAQAVPAAVQRSSSLDSMQNPVTVLPGNNEMLPTTLSPSSNVNNSLSPPCQPVQRSRSLPLLDSSQEIPPELLADLTERGNLLGNNSVGIVDGLSTSQASHQGGQFLQRDYLHASQQHLTALPQQPLNLSQSADVKQFLSPFQQPRLNMSRQVRNLLPHLGDWSSYQTTGRLPLRGSDAAMAGFPAVAQHAMAQGQTLFNPSVANIYSKVMDKALGFPISESFSFGRENLPFQSGQSSMNMNPLRQQGTPLFEGKPTKEGERQLTKDVRGNLVHAHQHHNENNNDKTSPNMQTLSDGVGGHLGDKSMLPLSVSVSVAFSEPSQDSPASLSRHSNSPAMPYRTSADQMLSMINYNEDQLLQEHGLITDNSVTGTLDDNFLGGPMGMGHPGGSRLTDSSNLTGMDSSPPSVNNETFDLFDGGGDVDEANYMTDSLSPQPLPGNVDPDVHVTTSLPSIGSSSGSDVMASVPRGIGRGGVLGMGGGKNPPDGKSSTSIGVNNDGTGTDVPPRRKGRPPSRNPGHRYSQPCQVCGKIFGSSSALAKHKLIHSSERRHKCVLCAKSFKRQDHLAGHMLTHRSKKPYECTVPDCGKSYCDIRSLRRHFESQHHGLAMEDNMNYTGDERDPELIAAEEAAAVQAQAQVQAQVQGHPPPPNSSTFITTVNTMSSMGSLTVNNFSQGLMQQQQPQHQAQHQQAPTAQQQGGMNNTNNQNSDSQGSSSSAALQFLAQAAQRAQTNNPIQSNSPNNPSDSQHMSINPQLPVHQDVSSMHRFPDLINPSNQLPSSTWTMSNQYETLPNPRNFIMDGIPAPRLSTTTISGASGNPLTNPSTRPVLGNSQNLSIDVRQPSPRGPSPAKSSDGREKVQQPVECSVCKRMFKSMPALNGHMRLHGGYNNARAESDSNKVDHKPQPKQRVPTPPRSSQARYPPESRVTTAMAPVPLSIPNHQFPLAVSQGSVNPMQSTSLHMSVPAPPFGMQMQGLSQPPQMTQQPNVSQLRPAQLDLQTQVKRELNVPSVPKQVNPFFQDALFPPHQPLTSTYPQYMPVHFANPVKDMPYPIQMNYPPTSSTVQMLLKSEPVNASAAVQHMPLTSVAESKLFSSEHELSPPKLEAIKPSEDHLVFRNPPPPTQTSPTKKRPRPSPLHIPSCVNTGSPGSIIPGTYQSQMRSPREMGGMYQYHYRSAGTGTTPPPYTPPPMLSPIRSGPGLYFNVGQVPALPTMTPKTPSMISMHRRSSASVEEPASDFAFSTTEPHINMGPEFQATIPDLKLVGEDENDFQRVEPLGWLAWHPSTNDKYTTSELTNFLMLATTAALPGGARNIEYAHHCLQIADGDIEYALEILMNPQPVPEVNEPFNDYNYNFTSSWTPVERRMFRDHFKAKGKDFHEIQKALATKAVKEIVEYYYRWKKLYPYNNDMQKFCHHSGLNPTEEMRRHGCDLFPDETFIDYVPLKEYRHDKYYRGGGQTRNNNHVKTSSNQEEKPVSQGPFTCNYPDCEATFKSRQALNGHIRVHGGSYKCQPASKEVQPVHHHSPSPASISTSTSGTSRRMSTDSSSGESVEPEPVIFPCKICGKVFEKVKSRSAHMKSHRKPDVIKKPPTLPTHMETPLESPLPEDSPLGGESPPEFGTEPMNHYNNDDDDDDDDDDEDEDEDDDDSEDDDMDEEEDERGEEDSSSDQSGSRSESSSGSESESENSETDLMTM